MTDTKKFLFHLKQDNPILLKAAPLIKEVENYWKNFLIKEKFTPHLHVILLGDNPASKLYIKKKSEACTRIGLLSTIHHLKEETSESQLLDLIIFLNNDKSCNGILIQSPLPRSMNTQKVFSSIDPKKDVDGFHPFNRGQHLLGNQTLIPCTTLGLRRLLAYYKIDLKGKNIALFGRSSIVGYPTLIELINADATVHIYHSKSCMKKFHPNNYEIIILATGNDLSHLSKILTKKHIVIDIGIFKKENIIQGDLRDNAKNLEVKAITPVPGGIGPMTVNSLLFNTIISFFRQSSNQKVQSLEEEFLSQTMGFLNK